MNLHILRVAITIAITAVVPSTAFVPSQQRRNRPVSFYHQLKHQHHHYDNDNKRTNIYSATNKDDEIYDFFDEEFDDEDEEDARNSLSTDEKKKLAKDFFAHVLDYNEDEMKPEEVHIILFNQNTSREGVHTLEFPKDSGNNIILAFESKEECEEFSMNLKKQHFFDPVPREMNLENLEEYCKNIGVDVQVIPEGTQLKPPTEKSFNLGLNPDLEKEMKLLENLFQISTTETNDDMDTHNNDEETGAWE